MCPTIFFTYKTSFTTFQVDWSQKIDKNFFEPFFQKILQVFVPLRDQNFNFWKKSFRQFFHLQNMFHNISRWLKPKNRQKFFRTIFAKKFTSYCPPTGPKFQFLEKVCPTIFFTYKTSFTTFHVDWSQKIDKNFFEPFIQKFLQVIVPLWDQNFNFSKKCFRQFFSLKNRFHNISRWLKPKIRQKFFRTNFSKFFTSYCPRMGPKFPFLKKVFPTIFFTYKTCFTTFRVDWSQKIGKNFVAPFFQKPTSYCPPTGPKFQFL